MAIKAKINKDVLVWAREESGFSAQQAAEKMKIKPERLEDWENGSDHPTIHQLRKISEVYKRPLAVFYLNEVPKKFRVMHDFRQIHGESSGLKSPQLLVELRGASQRRDLALELYRETGEEVPDFNLRVSLSDDPEKVAEKIRNYLGITIVEQMKWPDERAAFNHWRTKIEEKSVLVFQVTTLPLSEMRGFSIAEQNMPVIGVNRKDVPGARSFSLLHELTHVMLGKSGICDIEEFYDRKGEEQKTEIFCNMVAGATLVPAAHLLTDTLVVNKPAYSTDWSNEAIQVLAKRFCVSRIVIIRRLLILGKTTEAFYRQKTKEYFAQYQQSLEKSPLEEGKTSFKKNMAMETLSVFGRHFTETILNSYYQKRITLNDVSAYLGVKLRHIPNIEQRMGAMSAL